MANFDLSFGKSTLIFVLLNGLFTGISRGADINPADCVLFEKAARITEKHIGYLKDCANELKGSGNMCIIKCAMMKIGLLGPDGNPDIPATLAIIDTSVPLQYQDEAKKLVAKCSEDAGKIDTSDATCETYKPLVTCAIKGVTKGIRTGVKDAIAAGKLSPANIAKCTGLAARVEQAIVRLESLRA